jgi:hypothetical protein
VSTFPRKLSESGLFRSVKGHEMVPALIPYSVNSVLWSDGAFKERWLGIPGNGKIDFTTSRGWNFPDETVIVKSFGLEMEEGNPASRRWIETRFLTKQGGEWFGYSYAWNDEQTEGVLIEKSGADREYQVKTEGGVRKQLWHYPSRAECMVCHSRAANWVLGLTELQMNRDFHYGKVTDNQLRTFEHLGLFKVNWYDETRNLLREEAKKKDMSGEKADKYLEQLCATKNQREPVISSLLTMPPAKRPRLVDPADKKQDLTLRARSYLHSNCAQCHVDACGGNAQIDLEFTTPLEKMRLLGVKPQHDTFGLEGAKLIVPGHPEQSVLLHRIANRDKGFMPPLATRLVDRETVELMREWILHLPPPQANNLDKSLPKGAVHRFGTPHKELGDKAEHALYTLAFSPDEKKLLTGAAEDGVVRMWDLTNGEQVQLFKGHQRAVRSLAVSPDGKMVATSGHDGTIRLWDMASAKELRTLKGQKRFALSVAFSPDGTALASGGEDHTISMWDVKTGAEMYQLFGHAREVAALAFSQDGKQLASGGSWDYTACFWDLPNRRVVHQIQKDRTVVNAVALSPDGKWLALAGGYDDAIRLIDTATGKEVRQLQGHTLKYIHSVAFSPDGKKLVSGGMDKTVRMWDVASRKEERVFSGHDLLVHAVCFSPSGRYVASASYDGTAIVWEVERR